MGLKKLSTEPQRTEVRKSGRLEARGWRVGRSLNVHGAQRHRRLQGSRSAWR
jgi:hypothetical protein